MPPARDTRRGPPPKIATLPAKAKTTKVEPPTLTEKPFPKMAPGPDPEKQIAEHAAKVDANLRLGGRYPYTPNPKFREVYDNPIFGPPDLH